MLRQKIIRRMGFVRPMLPAARNQVRSSPRPPREMSPDFQQSCPPFPCFLANSSKNEYLTLKSRLHWSWSLRPHIWGMAATFHWCSSYRAAATEVSELWPRRHPLTQKCAVRIHGRVSRRIERRCLRLAGALLRAPLKMTNWCVGIAERVPNFIFC